MNPESPKINEPFESKLEQDIHQIIGKEKEKISDFNERITIVQNVNKYWDVFLDGKKVSTSLSEEKAEKTRDWLIKHFNSETN